MKKSDLLELMNINEGYKEFEIDWNRKLVYGVHDKYSMFGSYNEAINKNDNFTLQFNTGIRYGEIPVTYTIKSRNVNDILQEIKIFTQEYFNNCIEYFNGNKRLPNNWDR